MCIVEYVNEQMAETAVALLNNTALAGKGRPLKVSRYKGSWSSAWALADEGDGSTHLAVSSAGGDEAVWGPPRQLRIANDSRARQTATQAEDVEHGEASQVGDENAWSDARQAGWGSRKQDAKHETDWACRCGAVNGYGTQCRSCQAWHPWRWECKCGEINWHDKKQCRSCEAPHPDASV